jgi:hypothetical protein
VSSLAPRAVPCGIAIAFLLMLAALAAPLCHSHSAPNLVTTKVSSHFDAKMEKVEFAVTNLSKVPMTALIIAIHYAPVAGNVPPHTMVRTEDSLCDPSYHPQMWKETRTFVFGGPGPDKADMDVELKGALFMNGSSFGDPGWVKRLVDRRKFFYQYVVQALQMVQNASSVNETGDQLAQEASSAEKADVAQAQSPAERMAIRDAFDCIVFNLKHMISTSPMTDSEKMDSIARLLIQKRQALATSKPPVAQQAARSSSHVVRACDKRRFRGILSP